MEFPNETLKDRIAQKMRHDKLIRFHQQRKSWLSDFELPTLCFTSSPTNSLQSNFHTYTHVHDLYLVFQGIDYSMIQGNFWWASNELHRIVGAMNEASAISPCSTCINGIGKDYELMSCIFVHKLTLSVGDFAIMAFWNVVRIANLEVCCL